MSDKDRNENTTDRTIESSSHMLVIDKNSKEELKVIDGKAVRTSSKNYKLYIHEFMEKTSNKIAKIVHELNKAGKYDNIHIFINSPGGLVIEGIPLIDTRKSKFNGRITTEILHQSSSMGSLTFMIGDKRITNIHSRHMMHNFSTFSMGKANDVKRKHDFMVSHIQGFMYKQYVISGVLSEADFAELIKGVEFWQTSMDMLKTGAATHLRINDMILPKKKAIKKLKKELYLK